MKKKLISLLALVLVVCFVWVAEVDAADLVIIYDRSYLTQVLRNSTSNNSIFDNVYLNYKGSLYSFPLTSRLTSSQGVLTNAYLPINLLPDMVLPSGFSIMLGETSASISAIDFSSISLSLLFLDDTSVSLVNGFDFYVTYTNSGLLNFSSSSNSDFSYCIAVIEFSDDLFFDKGISSIVVSSSANATSTVNFYFGFLIREDGILYNASYAGSGITPEQYQAIIEGIEDISTKMEDQNESLFTPEASDTDVIAEASSQKDKFDGVMSEYSSLNEALDRPDVNELLPDYSSVVGGYKDDEFYDVFDVFYGNGYIMFMLLASVFFATMSFVIFGKKA